MSKVKDIVKTAINPFWSESIKQGKKGADAAIDSMTPDMPEPEEPTVMPDADEAALMKKRKANIAKQQQRSGRASTILSDSKLGG